MAEDNATLGGREQQVDPREFSVPASDNKGHSERMWLRIQSGHDRQMAAVLNSKFFPYRSKGDVVRHALHRHLLWLETLAPVPSVSGQVDAILEIMREEEFHKDFQDIMSRLQEQVGYYLARGQVGRARSLVSRILDRVDRMPDSDWKDTYRKEILDQYSNLVSGDSVSLFGGSGPVGP